MMKKIIVLAVIAISIQLSNAQDKYFTKSGTVNFEASAGAAFEEVKAKNNSVTTILNTENGEIASLVLVKGFRFKNALMEEHFNENYMDSDKFPKSTFKGVIENFDFDKLTSEAKTYKIKGILTTRGKDKEINADAIIKKEGEIIRLKTDFIVTPQDFGIEIPKIVREKIAKEIALDMDFELKKR